MGPEFRGTCNEAENVLVLRILLDIDTKLENISYDEWRMGSAAQKIRKFQDTTQKRKLKATEALNIFQQQRTPMIMSYCLNVSPVAEFKIPIILMLSVIMAKSWLDKSEGERNLQKDF